MWELGSPVAVAGYWIRHIIGAMALCRAGCSVQIRSGVPVGDRDAAPAEIAPDTASDVLAAPFCDPDDAGLVGCWEFEDAGSDGSRCALAVYVNGAPRQTITNGPPMNTGASGATGSVRIARQATWSRARSDSEICGAAGRG